MPHCPHCGTAVRSTARFCTRCGTALAHTETPPSGPVATDAEVRRVAPPPYVRVERAPQPPGMPLSTTRWLPGSVAHI